MFGFKKKEPLPMRVEDLLAFTPPPRKYLELIPGPAIEYRPCYVIGKKALFHRWVNTANPALPRGQEPGENVRYFQYRNTKALVEFEDGSVDLVWPQSVKFADHGKFEEYAWDPVEQEDGGA